MAARKNIEDYHFYLPFWYGMDWSLFKAKIKKRFVNPDGSEVDPKEWYEKVTGIKAPGRRRPVSFKNEEE